MLFRLMARKFGQVSEEVKQKIEAADSNTLLADNHFRLIHLICVLVTF